MDQLDSFTPVCKIKILGVGGAGNNAVNCMYNENLVGCDFYVLNTDAQVLASSRVENKVLLGKDITRGLGAGAHPEIGEKAALDCESEIRDICKGADLIFIAAGMGGGTGTGAAPVVARIAKEEGALVVGIVTKPFTFEGRKRMVNAINGLNKLTPNVDSLITISNDRILQLIGNLPIRDSFKEADNVLRRSVQSITDLISIPCLINLDFADISTVMKGKGPAMIGFGAASGKNKAQEAAAKAIASPLLERSVNGAKSAILAICGGPNVTLYDAQDVVDYVLKAAGKDMNIIFGVSTNDMLNEEIQVTIIATDFDDAPSRVEEVTFDPTFERKPFDDQGVTIKELNEPVIEENPETSEFIPTFLKKR